MTRPTRFLDLSVRPSRPCSAHGDRRRTGRGWPAGISIALAMAAVVQLAGPWAEVPGIARAEAQGAAPASKLPSIVEQRIQQLQAERAGLRVGRPQGDRVRVTGAGELELEFHANNAVGDKEKQDLVALGATILSSTGDLTWPPGVQPPAGLGVISARVPFSQAALAAALPWVVAVTPVEVNPPDVGTFLSEGVPLHGADVAQVAGVTGAGVTVGVISDGVSNLAASQALGELPATVTIPGGCGAGSGDEGTAMLEIVHDMAPGAALRFCATGGGVAAHVAALTNLAAAGVHVIAEDIAFDNEPAFQKGIAATTADTLSVSGISVHSSAGNLGNKHAARVQAVGTGTRPDGRAVALPAGCGDPQNVVAIAPGGDTTFDVVVSPGAAGTTLNVTLQWSEPRAIFPTAGAGGFTNLDLYVVDQGYTTCLGSSTGVQGPNGSGDTIEQVSVPFAAGAANQTVKIIVNVASTGGAVAPPTLDLRWRGSTAGGDATTRAGSLNPDSNYTDGATSAAAAQATSSDPTAVPIEGFSAGGPVQLITTTECQNHTYPCPGPAPAPIPVAGGAGRTVGAPTWTTADGVSVSGVGNFGAGSCPGVTQGDCRFFGTSAAAPHAAAIAALVREAMGSPTPLQLNARLGANATDRTDSGGAPGFDNVWGFGVLNAALAALGDAADLVVTKLCKPDGPITVGQTGTCTILVQNLGPDPARTTTIVDQLVSNGMFTIGAVTASAGTCSTTPNPQNGSGTVTCTVPSIAVNATVTITVPVTANSPQDINDVVTASSLTPDPNTGNNSASGAVHLVATSADLQVTKTCKPDGFAAAGSTATCTILVDNLGPNSAQDVVLTDTNVSSGPFSFGTITTSAGSCGAPAGGVVTCNLGTLAPGARVTITVPVTSSDEVDINDIATVTSSTADPNTANNSATGSVRFRASADLSITKISAPNPVVAGTNVTYMLSIGNGGPSTATNVVVKDTLPAQISDVSFTPSQGSCIGGIPGNPQLPLTCNLGSLANGANATITVTAKVDPATPAGTIIVNNAVVSSDTPDANNANNNATALTTVSTRADVMIVKTSDADTYKPSSRITYRIDVTNQGESVARAVVATDNLPDVKQALYQSDTGGCLRNSATNPTQLRCELGDLGVGESRTFFVVLLVKGNKGTVSNTASVTSTTLDPTPGNNSSTRVVTVGK